VPVSYPEELSVRPAGNARPDGYEYSTDAELAANVGGIASLAGRSNSAGRAAIRRAGRTAQP